MSIITIILIIIVVFLLLPIIFYGTVVFIFWIVIPEFEKTVAIHKLKTEYKKMKKLTNVLNSGNNEKKEHGLSASRFTKEFIKLYIDLITNNHLRIFPQLHFL